MRAWLEKVRAFERRVPQGLKPLDVADFSARLKPCPDTKRFYATNYMKAYL